VFGTGAKRRKARDTHINLLRVILLRLCFAQRSVIVARRDVASTNNRNSPPPQGAKKDATILPQVGYHVPISSWRNSSRSNISGGFWRAGFLRPEFFFFSGRWSCGIGHLGGGWGMGTRSGGVSEEAPSTYKQ
jgi:hypothetical protein